MFNFKQTKLYTNFKKYYSGKNLFLRYFLIVFIIFLLILQFIKPRTSGPIITNQNFSNLNFAGEKVPFNGKYILNQERFDKEFLSIKENLPQFILTYRRQGLYLSYIENALQKAGLPDDLKYIAMIESNLKDNVVSSAGAAGLRQLMPGTASKYGLVVNDLIDERYDAYKSTDAIVKYFKDIYPLFNNRTLTIAAYNRGENGLLLDMNNQTQNNYYDLYLNNETFRFIFRAVAMKYLMENTNSYFTQASLGSKYSIPSTKTISVGQIDDLIARANSKGYTYLEIKQLNPRIRSSALPEGNRELKVFKK